MDNYNKDALKEERYQFLHQLEEWLEFPVVILGFLWLVLLVIELIYGLSPSLEKAGYFIWAVFVIDFAIRYILAPDKLRYLKTNWLTALSLLIPALRIFRIVRLIRLFQLAKTARGLRLVKVLSTLNRGMRALRASMRRRGFPYVALLTVVVTFTGAAGMLAFEQNSGNKGFDNYGDALWWTSMIMTTLGSDSWPITVEGRILGFILALYAFAVFGYTTATLATFFVGREAEHKEQEAPVPSEMEKLRLEIRELKNEIAGLNKGNTGQEE